MKNYYRIMLGGGAQFAPQCHAGNYVSVGFFGNYDLTADLAKSDAAFRDKYRPIRLAEKPEKGKIGAGLACGVTLSVCKKLVDGDVVVCSNGQGAYLAGEIVGPYQHHPDTGMPHRRPVKWYPELLQPDDMSPELRKSVGTSGTGGSLTKYATELQALIGGQSVPDLIASNPEVEDPAAFALEKHLEDFLVANWAGTELGKQYDIYADDEGNTGQQYPSDTGPIDILAVSKDQSKLLVVELKKGRASDAVVGQVQRYMGFVLDELAESNQEVHGVIIALEDSPRIRRALRVTRHIDFYRYEVSFTLTKAGPGGAGEPGS